MFPFFFLHAIVEHHAPRMACLAQDIQQTVPSTTCSGTEARQRDLSAVSELSQRINGMDRQAGRKTGSHAPMQPANDGIIEQN